METSAIELSGNTPPSLVASHWSISNVCCCRALFLFVLKAEPQKAFQNGLILLAIIIVAALIVAYIAGRNG